MVYGPSNDPGALDAFVSIITGPPGPRPEQLVPSIPSPILLLWGDKVWWCVWGVADCQGVSMWQTIVSQS